MFNELLSLIEIEFQRSRRQSSEATDSMEQHAKAGEAMAYADVKMLIAELRQKHYSDCSLHNSPAYQIARCDCGLKGQQIRKDAIAAQGQLDRGVRYHSGFELMHKFRTRIIGLATVGERLYATTESGVYRMDKNGKRWRKVTR